MGSNYRLWNSTQTVHLPIDDLRVKRDGTFVVVFGQGLVDSSTGHDATRQHVQQVLSPSIAYIEADDGSMIRVVRQGPLTLTPVNDETGRVVRIIYTPAPED